MHKSYWYLRNDVRYAHGSNLEQTKFLTYEKLEHSMTMHILNDESTFLVVDTNP